MADRYFASFSPAVQADALQAFDLLNLWLARRWIDGSVFPTRLGVNPQMSIYAIAARNATRLAAALGARHTT